MFYHTVNLTYQNPAKVILKIKKVDFFEILDFFEVKERLLRQFLNLFKLLVKSLIFLVNT